MTLTLVDIDFNQPVKTVDGKLGLFIRIKNSAAEDEGDSLIGVQVPGEENIRWIPLSNLHDLGGGALIEIAEPLVRAQSALKGIQQVIHNVEARCLPWMGR